MNDENGGHDGVYAHDANDGGALGQRRWPKRVGLLMLFQILRLLR